MLLAAILAVVVVCGAAMAIIVTVQTDRQMQREEQLPEEEPRGFEVIMKPVPEGEQEARKD